MYDSRQVFFTSIGVILLIFGFYPAYITEPLSLITLKIRIFHIIIIILGGISSCYGINLWQKKDEDTKEIVTFFKEEMKRNNELKKVEIQWRKLNIDKEKLNYNLEYKKVEEKKQEKEEIERECKASIEGLNKLKENIEKREKALLEKEAEIYNKRNESINELPSTFYLSSGSQGDFLTGSPATIVRNSETNSFSSNDIYPFNAEKIRCFGCNKIFYVPFGTSFKECPYCHCKN